MAARRIVRTPLPVELIREMDGLIVDGVGGYETRAEFIEDAIRERILELTFEDAGQPGEIDATLPPESSSVSPTVARSRPAAIARMDDTTVRSPGRPVQVVHQGVDRPEDEPLFGLHNRDYPSLWSLAFLARTAVDGPVPLSDFEHEVCGAAWEFGEVLAGLERSTGQKLTGLFPTNSEKRESSESAFRMFAVGDHRASARGVRTRGPLYQWRVARLTSGADGLRVGVTMAGWELLEALDGLNAVTPHDRCFADVFFAHLRDHAPADWWGFERLLEAVASGASTRNELIEVFASAPYGWSSNEVSTNAAGYVARCREWGLLEPKQTKGRYVLTRFGEEVSAQIGGNGL